MANKERLGGADAVIEFMGFAKLPLDGGQDLTVNLLVSAKAGDKWRLTKVRLPVEFQYNNGTPEVAIATIEKPFYRAYRHIPGTRFLFDPIHTRLFIEGNLNKGRGDPFVICLSR